MTELRGKTQIVFRSEGALKGQFFPDRCRKYLTEKCAIWKRKSSSRKDSVGLNHQG